MFPTIHHTSSPRKIERSILSKVLPLRIGLTSGIDRVRRQDYHITESSVASTTTVIRCIIHLEVDRSRWTLNNWVLL